MRAKNYQRFWFQHGMLGDNLKYTKAAVLLAITWFFMSCAHAPSRTSEGDSYTQGVQAQNLTELKAQSCSSDWQKLGWQKQLTWASGCLKSKNFFTIQKWAEDSIEKHPSSPWPAYYLSLTAFEEKKMNRALWFIEKSLEKVPDEGMFLYQKAKVLDKLGFATEAQITFQRAVDERPTIGKEMSKVSQ